MSTEIDMRGHNNPPEPTPFELSRQEADDLFMEASNWCDGAAVETQEQADALDMLREKIRAARLRADERRKEEARPHDEAKAEIQARYNTLIGDTKKTGKGKLILAEEAVNAARAPWLRKIEEEKQKAAAAARAEEEAKRKAAQEAFAKARDESDLEARAEAEKLAAEAKKAEQQAKRADKAAMTKTGLKTVVHAEITDLQEFARWSWVHDRAALEAHFIGRAMAIASDGWRDVPGLSITETREAR